LVKTFKLRFRPGFNKSQDLVNPGI